VIPPWKSKSVRLFIIYLLIKAGVWGGASLAYAQEEKALCSHSHNDGGSLKQKAQKVYLPRGAITRQLAGVCNNSGPIIIITAAENKISRESSPMDGRGRGLRRRPTGREQSIIKTLRRNPSLINGLLEMVPNIVSSLSCHRQQVARCCSARERVISGVSPQRPLCLRF
jgi:hypothetical protein